MRKLFMAICLSLLFFSLPSSAQTSVMLYPDYQAGVVYMTGGMQVRTPLNYDAGKHCVMYRQNGEDMVLLNIQQIDSLHIGQHHFCRVKNKFYEVVGLQGGNLLIDWQLTKTNVGYKGAFGNVSQVRSQSVNLSLMSQIGAFENNDIDNNQEVYKQKNKNKYMLLKGDRLESFANKKQLLKLFPNKETEVENLIKEHATDFTKTEDIIKLAADLIPLL